MVDVKERLYDEFNNEMLNLRGMEMGSKEYQASVDGVTKIVDRLIAIDEKERSNATNKKKMRDEQIDRWIENGVKIVKLAAGIGVPIWITVVSMGFEKEDTMTYSAGREAIKTCLSFMKKG